MSGDQPKDIVLKMMSLLVDPSTSEQARQYLSESYVQHNPNIDSGADAIIEWTKTDQAREARESMRPAPEPPVFVTEGDKVVMMLARDLPDPDDPGKTYRSYWFDMWRIEDGKLAEHWDGAPKEAAE
ncbi:nuclear transport factor 2 family protein [Streptomyces sp. BK205]|uniref:nuclear transport factor 2 family protein n=1 Tax=Streptomyces sp. BK205 TaxID=2512164 RepID=UPI001050D4CA|nr:nuclear transport factor 2 family protein [Streptomyces sp. BK205]TCR26171.1 putative SnoaL-like aldol condensation-catalyzing enzyme [Streptomyces sp. BK205]